MSAAAGLWFSGLVAFLFIALLGLRAKFPGASAKAETVVVGVATVLFFSLCGVFLRP